MSHSRTGPPHNTMSAQGMYLPSMTGRPQMGLNPHQMNMAQCGPMGMYSMRGGGSASSAGMPQSTAGSVPMMMPMMYPSADGSMVAGYGMMPSSMFMPPSMGYCGMGYPPSAIQHSGSSSRMLEPGEIIPSALRQSELKMASSSSASISATPLPPDLHAAHPAVRNQASSSSHMLQSLAARVGSPHTLSPASTVSRRSSVDSLGPPTTPAPPALSQAPPQQTGQNTSPAFATHRTPPQLTPAGASPTRAKMTPSPLLTKSRQDIIKEGYQIDPSGKLHCVRCYYNSHRLDKMEEHVTAHLYGKFICNICGKAFIKNCDLDRHTRAHRKGTVISNGNKPPVMEIADVPQNAAFDAYQQGQKNAIKMLDQMMIPARMLKQESLSNFTNSPVENNNNNVDRSYQSSSGNETGLMITDVRSSSDERSDDQQSQSSEATVTVGHSLATHSVESAVEASKITQPETSQDGSVEPPHVLDSNGNESKKATPERRESVSSQNANSGSDTPMGEAPLFLNLTQTPKMLDIDPDSLQMVSPSISLAETYSTSANDEELNHLYDLSPELAEMFKIMPSIGKDNHGKEGPMFRCTICNYRTRDRQYVEKHYDAHTNQDKICKICGKAFDRPFDLQRHEERHLGIKRSSASHHKKGPPGKLRVLHCSKCGFATTEQRILVQHRLKQHPDRNFTCEICKGKFASFATMKIHQMQVHQMDIHEQPKVVMTKFGRVDSCAKSVVRNTTVFQFEVTSANEICIRNMDIDLENEENSALEEAIQQNNLPEVAHTVDINDLFGKLKARHTFIPDANSNNEPPSKKIKVNGNDTGLSGHLDIIGNVNKALTGIMQPVLSLDKESSSSAESDNRMPLAFPSISKLPVPSSSAIEIDIDDSNDFINKGATNSFNTVPDTVETFSTTSIDDGSSRDSLQKIGAYMCTRCNYSTNMKHKYDEHMKAHRGRFICKLCHKAFIKASDLTRHWITHKSKEGKVILCDQCNFKSEDPCIMEDHMKMHYRQKPRIVCCKYCNKGFDDRVSRRNHETICKDNKGGVPDTRESLCCPSCGLECQDLKSINIHKKTCHAGKEFQDEDLTSILDILNDSDYFECPTCYKTFSSKEKLKKHRKLHIASQKGRAAKKAIVEQSSEEQRCEYCLKIFCSVYYLRDHMNTHTGEKPYECQACGMKFPIRQQMSSHLGSKACQKRKARNKAEAKKEKEDSLDNKTIPELLGLQPRRASSATSTQVSPTAGSRHSPKTGYACSYCGKTFSSKQYMQDHENTHTGATPHECSTCGEKFAVRQILSKHRIDSGCGSSSTSPRSTSPRALGSANVSPRARVQRLSEAEQQNFNASSAVDPDFTPPTKGNKCHFCGKKFTTLWYLKDHLNLHLGKTPHECSRCKQQFALRTRVSNHLCIPKVETSENTESKSKGDADENEPDKNANANEAAVIDTDTKKPDDINAESSEADDKNVKTREADVKDVQVSKADEINAMTKETAVIYTDTKKPVDKNAENLEADGKDANTKEAAEIDTVATDLKADEINSMTKEPAVMYKDTKKPDNINAESRKADVKDAETWEADEKDANKKKAAEIDTDTTSQRADDKDTEARESDGKCADAETTTINDDVLQCKKDEACDNLSKDKLNEKLSEVKEVLTNETKYLGTGATQSAESENEDNEITKDNNLEESAKDISQSKNDDAEVKSVKELHVADSLDVIAKKDEISPQTQPAEPQSETSDTATVKSSAKETVLSGAIMLQETGDKKQIETCESTHVTDIEEVPEKNL